MRFAWVRFSRSFSKSCFCSSHMNETACSDIIAPYENRLVAILTKSTRILDDARHCNLFTGKFDPLLFKPSFKDTSRLMLICTIILIIALFLFITEHSYRKILLSGNRKQVQLFRRTGVKV